MAFSIMRLIKCVIQYFQVTYKNSLMKDTRDGVEYKCHLSNSDITECTLSLVNLLMHLKGAKCFRWKGKKKRNITAESSK